MDCYIMRHAEALSGMPDWQRPLSDRGRSQATAVAQRARAVGVTIGWVYHSGLLRAQQTAELAAAILSPSHGVEQVSGLGPNDDPLSAADHIDGQSQSLLVVSHLPIIDRLAGFMALGDSNRSVVEFAPATMVCLSRQGQRWRYRWSISPDS